MIMQERGHARGRGMKNLAGGAFIPAETGGGGERSSGERTSNPLKSINKVS